MKHIKLCKPQSQESKKEILSQEGVQHNKVEVAKKTKTIRGTRLLSEGLRCVPTGNLVDCD